MYEGEGKITKEMEKNRDSNEEVKAEKKRSSSRPINCRDLDVRHCSIQLILASLLISSLFHFAVRKQILHASQTIEWS